jgi:extracellular matrix regulatory protein A
LKSTILLVGMNNYVPKNKIEGFYDPDSRPMRKVISLKRDEQKLIDATHGRKTRSVILLENGYIILSSNTPETLATRFEL